VRSVDTSSQEGPASHKHPRDASEGGLVHAGREHDPGVCRFLEIQTITKTSEHAKRQDVSRDNRSKTTATFSSRLASRAPAPAVPQSASGRRRPRGGRADPPVLAQWLGGQGAAAHPPAWDKLFASVVIHGCSFFDLGLVAFKFMSCPKNTILVCCPNPSTNSSFAVTPLVLTPISPQPNNS